MNAMQAILARRSCRDYTGEQITPEQLEQLLIAANAAPVGMGRFENVALTVIQSRELLQKIEEATVAAMPDMPNKHPLYNAPTGILVSIKNPASASSQMNAACVVQNILIEAAELGLGSTFIAGAVRAMQGAPELCAAARVPEGFEPAAMAIVGKSAAPVEPQQPTTQKFATSRV